MWTGEELEHTLPMHPFVSILHPVGWCGSFVLDSLSLSLSSGFLCALSLHFPRSACTRNSVAIESKNHLLSRNGESLKA